VIASGALRIGTEPRRAAEFSEDRDQNLPIDAALVDVIDQRGDRLIEIRQPDVHELSEMTRPAGVQNVVIPIREFLAALRSIDVEVDHRCPGFRQTPGQ
jgi:hypothetical protein